MAKSSSRGATRRQPAKKKRKAPAAAKQLPGWIWLVAGLAIGLFVAFLMHLGQLQKETDQTAVAPVTKPEAKPAAKAPETKKAPSNLPQFDFYAVLPKAEVVLPKSEQAPSKPRQPDTSKSTSKAEPSSPAVTPTVPAAEDKGRFLLQAGSFKDQSSAEKVRADFTLQGFSVHVQPGTLSNGETWYRVMIGPFGDRAAMRTAQDKLAAKNIDTLPIQVTKP